MMEKVLDCIVSRMRGYWKALGRSKAVIGVSGGKDSTVCAALCVRAFGPGNVIAVSIPHVPLEQYDDDRIVKVMEAVGMDAYPFPYVQSICKAERELTSCIPFKSPQAEINVKPRLRTALEYYIAQSLDPHALVVCTANFDEILLGWYTLWGDAGDYAPINRLHVSEVIELGRAMGIPEELLSVPPSDGLTGKTDEENFGFTYKDVEDACRKVDTVYDEICPGRLMGELPVLGFLGVDPGKALDPERRFDTETERKIYERWKANLFKQRMMSIPGPGDDIRELLDRMERSGKEAE